METVQDYMTATKKVGPATASGVRTNTVTVVVGEENTTFSAVGVRPNRGPGPGPLEWSFDPGFEAADRLSLLVADLKRFPAPANLRDKLVRRVAALVAARNAVRAAELVNSTSELVANAKAAARRDFDEVVELVDDIVCDVNLAIAAAKEASLRERHEAATRAAERAASEAAHAAWTALVEARRA